MESTVKKIYTSLEEMYQACDSIYARGCEHCPLSAACIRDMTLWSLTERLPIDLIREFIKESEKSSDDPWEYEADEANLRRCDPDWD